MTVLARIVRRPRRGQPRRRSRGQSLVEFALVLPIFLFILMLMLDFGRVVYAYHTLTQDAQEAERNGVVSPALTIAKYTAIRGAGLTMSTGTPLAAANITGASGVHCSSLPSGVDDSVNAGTCFYPDGIDSGNRMVVNITVSVPIITPIISSVVGGSIPVNASTIGYLP